MLVAGGSTASVVLRAAFRTGNGRLHSGRGGVARKRSIGRVLGLVEAGNVKAALGGEPPQQVVAIGRLPERALEGGDQRFALSGRDHVGKRRERLGIDERHRPADDDQRVASVALDRASRNAGEAQEGENVHVVPFEGDRKREHIEVDNRGLRLQRDERRPGSEKSRELLFWRQEDPLAHDVVVRVEQPVDRLETQIRHTDPVRVRERESDAQTIAVRLANVPDFLREDFECAFLLFPGFHDWKNSNRGARRGWRRAQPERLP